MDINNIIAKYEVAILAEGNRIEFSLSSNWEKGITSEAGVYVFIDKNEIVYVGQSKSLKARMGDVRRTVNHTLRRKIGEHLFSNVRGYEKASSKKKFPEHIELLINDYMNELNVSILPIPFGRCETEEFLISKYNPKYNSKSIR